MVVLEDVVKTATLEFQISELECRLPSLVPEHLFDMLKVFSRIGIIWNQFQDVLTLVVSIETPLRLRFRIDVVPLAHTIIASDANMQWYFIVGNRS